jgi:hypothetical protein
VSFGASPATAPFATFENKARLSSTTLPGPTIAALSATGTNGAFVAAGDANEIGSPGTGPSGLSVTTSSGALDLIAALGAPAGSTFSGPGVNGTTFDPTGLTAGVKTITYNYPGGSTTFNITVSQDVPAIPAWAWLTLPIALGFVALRGVRKTSLKA